MSLLGIYRPRGTWLHRIPAGYKLAVVAGASITALAVSGPWFGVGALLAGAALLAAARAPARATLKGLLPITILAISVGVYQGWRQGVPSGVETASELLAIVVLATVVTVTTSMTELTDTWLRWLGPLRHVGVDPERIALSLSLMLQAIPRIGTLFGEVREAAAARGLGRSPRALLVPTVLRTINHAQKTGEALAARGLAP